MHGTTVKKRKNYAYVVSSHLQIEQLSTPVYGRWIKTKEDNTWHSDQHDLSWAADYNV
jgi:hypothetical protein